jgi:uncharacterized protein YggE
MTRDLWLLAATAVFALSVTFFAGTYHPESYSVARPQITVVGTGEVASRPDGAVF